MSNLFSRFFSKNEREFSDLVWTKKDIHKWKILKEDPEKRALLNLWYIEVYTSMSFPPGVKNQLTEEEVPLEVESVLMSYDPPKIRNKKRIVTVLIVIGIIAAIGIYYGITQA